MNQLDSQTSALFGSGRNANYLLAFAVETAALLDSARAVYGYAGTLFLGSLSAACFVLMAGLVWNRWAAPKASHRLDGFCLLIFKSIALGAGAIGVRCAWGPMSAVGLLSAMVLHMAPAWRWRQL